jgi:alpha-amylase
VTGVSVTPTTLSLDVGAKQKLVATVTPPDAADKTVTYKSSDTSIATVASDGTVTAVKAGSATITATAGGKSATVAITVTEPTPPAEG